MNMNTDLNSMSFDELVPSESKYMKQSDVGEDGVILTIKGFNREVLKSDDGDETKVIMHFMEDMKPMVLNKTNASLLGNVTGCASAGQARGKQIVVYADPSVGFGGKITGGLRIKKIAGAPKPARAAAPSSGFDAPSPFDDGASF